MARTHRTLLERLRIFTGVSARAGYLAALDQGLISAANFTATLILARSVSPTELGVYGVGFTSLRLVRAVQEGLTIQPMNAYGAAMDPAEFRRYATSTTLLQVLLAVLASGGVALLGWIATEMGNDVAGPAIFALWPAFLWWQLQEYIRRMMYTRQNVLWAALNTLVANLARLGLMGWWLVQGRLDGAAGLTAISLGCMVAVGLGAWQMRKIWTAAFDELPRTWARNWGFGRWIIGAQLANWVSVEFYPVLTAGMISFAAAGAYRALQNLVQPVQLLLRAMDLFFTPRLARAFAEQGRPGVNRQVRIMYVILGTPILGLLGLSVMFREPILRFLYEDTYLAFADGVIWMALFYGLWFAYWPLQSALKAMRFSQPIFLANAAAILAMFTLGIWFISRWGVFGTLAGQSLNAAIVFVLHLPVWARAMGRVQSEEVQAGS
jgi:O-antigen/teichoic acid export membrane protein